MRSMEEEKDLDEGIRVSAPPRASDHRWGRAILAEEVGAIEEGFFASLLSLLSHSLHDWFCRESEGQPLVSLP